MTTESDCRIGIQIQREAFDVGLQTRLLRTGTDGRLDYRVGAVASFIGTVRDLNEGDAVKVLNLEHYPGMTESAIAEIIDDARQRWPLYAVSVIHRIGPLQPADEIVWVGAASAHREAALAACAFVMDFLKSRAPFWKKEELDAGSRWVSARDADEEALKRW
jgi:molybdopterin synthase catalytic subunit